MKLTIYETTPTIYFSIAELLFEKIGLGDFFSGSVTLNDGDVECRLITTLVVVRDKYNPNRIVALRPVWWEFKTNNGVEELMNDFSFDEMLESVDL